MNWGVITFLVAGLVLTGCRVKDEDDYEKEIDQIVADSQQRIDELTKAQYRGGQPGKIIVSGILVHKSDGQTQIDDRLKVEQIGGKGNRGVSKAIVSDQNKAVFSEEVDEKKIANLKDFKNYINLGCDHLTASETDGLTLEPVPPTPGSLQLLSASKIFICGSQNYQNLYLSIAADHLVLKNANLKLHTKIGNLNISARKISLEGTNTIETRGLDAIIDVQVGPDLDVVVTEEIHGEGSLLLRTIGADCVQKDEK